jgi:uncharacterized protein YjiS (DUF1127 family)
MTTLSLTQPFTRVGHGFGHVARALLAQWRYAAKLRETQRYLSQMDDHMLSDLGVSRAQVAFELERAIHSRRGA